MTSSDTAAPSEIRFYRSSEVPYGCFSNLYKADVVVRGRTYGCVEAAYQSLKPRKAEVREWLLSAPYPRLLANMAHILTRADIAPKWSEFKLTWMMECLQAKYEQNEYCRKLLVETRDAILIEAGNVDNDVNRRWGIVNGVGTNYLGRMLMMVRASIGGGASDDHEMARLIDDGKDDLEAWHAKVYSNDVEE